MDRCNTGVQCRARDPQGIESFYVHDVEIAPPIHEDIGQTLRGDDCFDDKGVGSWMRDLVRVIALIVRDWGLQPQGAWRARGLYRVYLPVVGLVGALVVTPLQMVGSGHECWRRCLPFLPPGGGSKSVGALLESGSTLPVTLPLWPAPDGVLRCFACDGSRVKTGEVEFSSGVGEEVEGSELDAAPMGENPISGRC